MNTFKRLFVYIVLVTTLFARMDWDAIHHSYVKYNDWPHPSVETWWADWSAFRYNTALVFCPPCAALAEHYYFVFFEIEGSLAEREDLLLKHIPEGYEYEGVLAPGGFWWGQGGEDNSNEWKHISLLSWYLYWLPYTIVWWMIVGDLFRGRVPWWIRKVVEGVRWLRASKGVRNAGRWVYNPLAGYRYTRD